MSDSFAPPSAPTGPEMSTPETLTGIFFEPSRTFEALRARPRLGQVQDLGRDLGLIAR